MATPLERLPRCALPPYPCPAIMPSGRQGDTKLIPTLLAPHLCPRGGVLARAMPLLVQCAIV